MDGRRSLVVVVDRLGHRVHRALRRAVYRNREEGHRIRRLVDRPYRSDHRREVDDRMVVGGILVL